jgi:hypothetical protein
MKAILLAAYMTLAISARAQDGAASVAPSSVTPVTKTQLEKLFVLTQESDEQTAAFTHLQLEQKRATLPAWFPKAVWDDVERNVEAIHYADLVLPIYQKYVSSEQADAEMLLFGGPTGQKIASVLSGRSQAVAQAGYRGSAGDQQVTQSLKGDNSFQALITQRFSELTPEERTKLQVALPAIRATLAKIDDETHEAYKKRSNEVLQTTLAAHQAEIVKAQQNVRRQ